MKRSDAGRNPDEREESVNRPHRSTSCSSREETWKNLGRGSIQYLGIIESSSEESENSHERERARYQKDSANSNYPRAAHAPPLQTVDRQDI